MSEEEIFHQARARTNPDERAAYLVQACGGDAALRASVEALLQADVGATGFMERTAPDVNATLDVPTGERPGTVIGLYKLIEQIGEGGMGTVWMAQQTEPVKRLVAVKLIKAGMDSKQVIARFEAERQALALMDHPNIARVLDAGTTDAGRPYFVMDLVKGVPITEYCDKNRLRTEARLGLFIEVCRAVQHAHHKGVIHRDIKPSNVLVTLHDGAPAAKVIDFGVAKATAQKLTERTYFTAYGQMIGTPAYMSPEQAEMSGLDIDTRSDVYSLGVLLYELLTGTTPLESRRLREVGYTEVQRMIREVEAPRPSSRLSSLGDSATIVAGNRGTDVKQLVRQLAGDLDWIVVKALEKDRNRRYESPNALAEDIERSLRHEPIKARPPTLRRTLSRFVRRNRVAVGVAATVTLALGIAAALGVGLLMGKVREQSLALTVMTERQARDREDRARRSLPEVRRAMEAGHPVLAYKLAREAKEVLPDDATLAALWQELTATATLQVEPEGTTVLIRDWDSDEGDWIEAETTPLANARLPRGPIRWKFDKAGHVPVELQFEFPAFASTPIRLLREGEVPPGMVPIPQSLAKDFPDLHFDLGPFAVDRDEVTNREFNRFVAAGGYDDDKYWRHEFIHQGKLIPREEARKLFVDRTGRPGPATWSDGRFPVGEDEFPVRGVSWYEAAAYAAYVGKDLPTMHHWQRISSGDIRYLIPLSNFEGRGPARVGSYRGITASGLRDLAGNVKEWCFNEAGDDNRRILRGGAWDEPGYVFLHQEVDSPTARKPTYGFRCVKYGQEPDDRMVAAVRQFRRPFEQESPPTPAELASYLAYYEYDATADLKAQLITKDKHPEWPDIRHEIVSIEAAYGGERFDIHLFWPRNASPPLDTIVWYPSSTEFRVGSLDEALRAGWTMLPLVRTGRLVCLPVYKGTLERRFGAKSVFELPPILYRDAFVMTAKDLRRNEDYLHTRDDVDVRRLIYGGLSQGAHRGPVMLVVEPRFQAAVLLFGGYWTAAARDEIEPLKFTRAVKTPVLMINGMLDSIMSYEPYQTLFYQHLGSVDKRFLPFENEGHAVPPAIAIPAVDKWLRAKWPAEQP